MKCIDDQAKPINAPVRYQLRKLHERSALIALGFLTTLAARFCLETETNKNQ
jgi:hypothetical protein